MLFIIISFVLLTACSPQRRLERLVRRHPELKTTDTISIRDTVCVPGETLDTVIMGSAILDAGCMMSDPVHLEKGRLQILLRKVHDTLYIRGKCKPDTVVIRRNIPVEKIRIIRPDNRSALIGKIPWIVAAVVAVCVAIIVGWIRKR